MMVSRREKNGKCPLFQENHVCLIIIAKMVQQRAATLSVLGAFSPVIFVAALPGGLGDNAATPLQNPIRPKD